MAFAHNSFAYSIIDEEIKKIISSKQKSKQATHYDSLQHGAYIADADWTLLNCVIRKALNESHMPRSLGESNLVLAEDDAKLMNYLSRYAETGQQLSAVELGKVNSISISGIPEAKYNPMFAEMLSERLEGIPDSKTCIMPINLSSARGIEENNQAHVISAGFRKDKNSLQIYLYESMPIEEKARAAQAVIIGQILQSLLPQYIVKTHPMPCGLQEGADCSLHAVFNSVIQERKNAQSLTFAECTLLRKALDEVNKTADLQKLEAAVTTILSARNFLRTVQNAPVTFSSSSQALVNNFSAKPASASQPLHAETAALLGKLQVLYNKYLKVIPEGESAQIFFAEISSLFQSTDINAIEEKLTEQNIAPFKNTDFGKALEFLKKEMEILLPQAPRFRH